MGGRNEDCATGMSSLANKEPLVVVKAGVDIMWEIVQKDCSDSRGSMVREREASLRHSGGGSVQERAFGAKDGDVGCGWGRSSHRGSEILATWRGDEDIIGIYSDIFVEWGEKEGVEDFLGDLGRSGRHRW